MDKVKTDHFVIMCHEDEDSHLNLEIFPIKDQQENEVVHVDTIEMDDGIKERYSTENIEEMYRR